MAAGLLLSLAPPGAAQLQPLAYDQGSTGLALQLRRLPVAGRVLYVTAHPDDEHNGVLVALSRGRGLRVGLLTLTRGDGGQNAIGPELFQALGVLRTGELMALHRYDAVEQYFSRAYEFGFSFSVDETLARWGHEETLGDVVRVVRQFRPDLILTLPLEGRGEHSHHLTAARLAREAFRAAADPARFPEQLVAGLRPWQARKLYQGGTGGDTHAPGPAPVRLPTGTYDPLLGLSWQELGSLERALHRSQSAGQLKADPNQGEGVYSLADAEPAVKTGERDLLDGVDVSFSALERFVPAEAARRAEVVAGLQAVESAARAAQGSFDFEEPEHTLPALRAGLTQVHALLELARGAGAWPADARAELVERLAEREELFAEALRRAHGLTLVATPSDDLVVPGQTLTVAVAAFNAGREALVAEGLELQVPEGWSARLRSGSASGPLEPGGSLRAEFELVVAAAARPSGPYWRRSPERDRYELELPADESRPWSAPPVSARLRYRSGEAALAASAPALARYEGRFVGGERQKELAVAPALGVRLSPGVAVIGTAAPAVRRELRVTVTSYGPGPARAEVRLEAPAGWSVEPSRAALEFAVEGEEKVTRFGLQAPAHLAAGAFELRAVAKALPDGREYREGAQVVAYDHVQERRLYRPASARGLALDVRLRPGVAVGYVPGLGDELPEALGQLGVALTVLSPDELGEAALERFSTIVLGVRAYADARLRALQPRLLRFAEGGGHLVVQYGRNEFNQAGPAASRAVMGAGVRPDGPADSPFAPYPASVGSRRISDERAPLRVLAPEHPLLREPNAIGSADWDGWVQERAIQLLDARDPRYVELLASTDSFPENPGEQRGLLVDAPVGKGSWTYVALGLFRQLPAGTPGAYRLLANLVSRPRGK